MRSLFKFFLLTYIVSWFFWIAAAAISGGTASPPSGLAVLSRPIFLLGTIAPSLVALALSELTDGRAGTLALLRRIVALPARARWYVFAVGYFAAIKFAVALVHRIATGAWPPFSQTPWFIMLVAIVFSTPVQAGEEIGWRGYALPRLARHLGLARASIVLGVIWACWHLPFFFIPASDNFGRSFPVYVLAVTALSVAMAWLYWRTNGSLLLMMLMHAAVDNTNIVPSPVSAAANPFALRTSLVAWLTAALLWICAVCFLVQMRRAALLRSGQALSEIAPAESAPAT
ncbi:MAG: CPBP family intramembrane glutamic endopeptidase [Pyrinomonadaceae bacterium]